MSGKHGLIHKRQSNRPSPASGVAACRESAARVRLRRWRRPLFVVAKGASTAGIRLVRNNLRLAQAPFRLDEGAPADAVKLETAGKE